MRGGGQPDTERYVRAGGGGATTDNRNLFQTSLTYTQHNISKFLTHKGPRLLSRFPCRTLNGRLTYVVDIGFLLTGQWTELIHHPNPHPRQTVGCDRQHRSEKTDGGHMGSVDTGL